MAVLVVFWHCFTFLPITIQIARHHIRSANSCSNEIHNAVQVSLFLLFFSFVVLNWISKFEIGALLLNSKQKPEILSLSGSGSRYLSIFEAAAKQNQFQSVFLGARTRIKQKHKLYFCRQNCEKGNLLLGGPEKTILKFESKRKYLKQTWFLCFQLECIKCIYKIRSAGGQCNRGVLVEL